MKRGMRDMYHLMLWMRKSTSADRGTIATPHLTKQQKNQIARFLLQEEKAGRLIRYAPGN